MEKRNREEATVIIRKLIKVKDHDSYDKDNKGGKIERKEEPQHLIPTVSRVSIRHRPYLEVPDIQTKSKQCILQEKGDYQK